MIAALKTFALHHIPWIVLVVVGLLGIHYWQAEHDARLQAEAKIKVDESTVATLQQAITQNNQQITQLQEQMNVRDAAAAKQVQSLEALVSSVRTPQAVVQALPNVTTLPVAPVLVADGSITFPSADAVPLFDALSQGKQDAIRLTQCTADLTDQKSITAKDDSTIADQTKQLALKDDEIKTLNKKPSFWHRVSHDLKVAAIAAGTVALLIH